MEIKVLRILNHGNQNEECVLLVVLHDCNIGNYELFDSTYTPDGALSNKVRHAYKFPDTDVKTDDYIAVWTKRGENRTEHQGRDIYRYFYLNLDEPIWNDDGDKADVRKVEAQDSFEVK